MAEIHPSRGAFKTVLESAERFIGYFYAGFLPILIFAIEKPDKAQELIQATGEILSLIICFALGIGIYTLYFRVIGEFIIYPIQHAIHWLLDIIARRSPNKRTSTIGILRHYGVPLFKCRDAYQTIKDELFTGQERNEIQVSHGELHVIYLTAIITLVSYFIINISMDGASKIYLLLSAVTFIAALIGDTHQHSREAFRLRVREKTIKDFLAEHGFI